MALKGKPIAVGTTDTDIYLCPATTEASVHGLIFANVTGSAATITIKLYIQSTGTTTTIATGISVAANSTYTWPKPVDMNANDKIIASASTGSAIVCLYSSYEGTATPAAVGFTGRGAWSSGATYAVNDVVSYNSTTYLAIQAGTNQTPNTATAYWMVLAAQGAAGTGDVTTNTAQTLTGAKRGAVTAANTGSFDMSAGNNFSCTPTGTATLTFTNITAGQSGFITLVNGSNYTIAKASAVKVATGVLTALSATGTYELSYHSPDGTNVYLTASGALA
ncbi:ChiA1_BD domain containing protein [uncultured Caudovirales phage]|uniref:ChiA1_BD domain containing protein n=1 Tax=uncultured Caudovirales phage TaxID=2100421 RepID=A0A6J5LFC6_9CAUD|nr:ChiA1_BD domain containing protein [uncultured Caudovirales phage]